MDSQLKRKRNKMLSDSEDEAVLGILKNEPNIKIKNEGIKENKIKNNEIKAEVKKLIKTEKIEEKVKKKRVLKKTEENFEPINRWWEKEDYNSDIQWTYLEHHGLIFTPLYAPHGIKIKFKGRTITLPPEAEEVANFWCGVLESDYAKKEKFRENFWRAFLSKLPLSHPIIVEKGNLEDCDFTFIKNYLDQEKEKKKNLTKEEKEELKRIKAEADLPYAYALVDWTREKVGNSKVEPPGLFRGRGEHPKQGMLKRRIFPEDVTLNIAEDAPVPKVVDMPGHAWSDAYHDNLVTWLAFYKDSINDQFKYMYLSAQSKFKGQQDMLKYQKARKLKLFVDKIREDYHKKMKSDDMTERQLGTAIYLIDFLALRVGGEKDVDEEADTVGCCSLRGEHITFNDSTREVTLDFLGKDSIRYLNTVKLHEQAYKNLRMFCRNKKSDDEVFDKINSISLNAYLKDLMPGLSAKVFRTYNASITLQKELEKINCDLSNPNELLQFYNDANREVAILCNHQRSIPKQHEASMWKMQKQLELIEEDIREMQEYLHFLKKDKAKKFLFSSSVTDLEGNSRKMITKEGMKEDAAKNKLKQLLVRKKNLELKIRIKDDNKTVALGTSKINYMDPRITVAFCKKFELPIEKVFNRSLRLKFPWAMFADIKFEF